MEMLAFKDFKKEIENKEGIVILGAGGEIDEWVEGITKALFEEKIVAYKDSKTIFPEKYILKTTGGRIDLVLVCDMKQFKVGKLAMWRIRFGDCSWISDYIVNYADQH